jgi:hypothetical protein
LPRKGAIMEAIGDRQQEPYGVGGWLLVLCLVLMILMPAVAVLGLVGSWQVVGPSSASQTALISETVIELALAALAAYAGWALYQRRPNAVRIAKVYFIVILALGILGLGLVFSAAVAMPGSANGGVIRMLRGPAAFAGFRQIVLSAVCLAYLARSKRVRMTYRRS